MEKHTLSLESLMVMEVPLSINQGPEVSAYVEKHFIEELTKNEDFKKGNIK